MANQLASFMNGSSLVIYIGDVQLAYCQSLAFNQNMTVVPVGGIGSFSNNALEPVQFAAGGQMRVVRWLTEQWVSNGAAAVPENLTKSGGTLGSDFTSGNGGLDRKHFDPVSLLLAATFDIKVYARQDGNDSAPTTLVYTLSDCRLTNYSFSFQPGSLLFEDLSFVCAQVQDEAPLKV